MDLWQKIPCAASFLPIQQVPPVAGENNCLSAHVITTLPTLGLSKGFQFLVSWGESRLAFYNSHFSSQVYLDPLLSTTPLGHRESVHSTTQATYLGTQAQLPGSNKSCLFMEVRMVAEVLVYLHTAYVSRHVAKPTGIYLNAILPWALRGHCRKPFPSTALLI